MITITSNAESFSVSPWPPVGTWNPNTYLYIYIFFFVLKYVEIFVSFFLQNGSYEEKSF